MQTSGHCLGQLTVRLNSPNEATLKRSTLIMQRLCVFVIAQLPLDMHLPPRGRDSKTINSVIRFRTVNSF